MHKHKKNQQNIHFSLKFIKYALQIFNFKHTVIN